MALMSEPVISLQDDTRKQLGAFLRARRESLDPQRLGLPRSGRRRTPWVAAVSGIAASSEPMVPVSAMALLA